jgi:uncharacterized membrane protein
MSWEKVGWEKMSRKVNGQGQPRSLVAIAAVFWIVCTVLVLQRYFNFYPTYVSFDQGIFNQVFWNTLHGHWFESSLSSTESSLVMQGNLPDVAYRRLGQHFTPALLLWLPWYALFPSAAGLSVLQVSLVTIAGFVLYALARHYHPPQLAGMIAASYYGAIAVISPTLANFHDICQMPLYLFGLLLALEKRRWSLVWLCAGLTLLVREDSGVVLFGIGFFLAVSRRSVRTGIALCAVSLAYMLVVTNLVMPLFSEDVSKRFMIEQFGQFTNKPEASTIDVIKGILSNPLRLVVELVTPSDPTIRYLLGQWVPLAFVSVISPSTWLLTGFPLVKVLIQREDITALSLHLRYAMTLIPGLFYGAILWWSAHSELWRSGRSRFRQIWIGCIVLSLFFTITSNPNRALSIAIPDSFQPWVYVSPLRQWQHSQAIHSLLSQIPPNVSVTATDHIVAHVSSRRQVLRFPMQRLQADRDQSPRDQSQQNKPQRVEYAIADLWYLQQYQPAFSDYRKSLQEAIGSVKQLQDRRYGVAGFADGVVLLHWKAENDGEAIGAWQQYLAALTPLP